MIARVSALAYLEEELVVFAVGLDPLIIVQVD